MNQDCETIQEESPGLRRSARSKAEVVRERDELHAATTREVERLAAEFHILLPRERARSIGTIYARYSTKLQASIGDQVRACYEAAVRQEIFVPTDHVGFDLATRGAKQRRPGLASVLALIESKEARVLLAFTTNRLHRKIYRCLQFVEEEIVERGLRAIFVKSGVDTADLQRWKMLLNVHATMDEFASTMYAENIRAAQEGMFDRGMVFGSVPLGYRGEPIDGQVTRRGRPKCRLAIDPATAPWVLQIFREIAEGSGTLDGLVHRLNGDPAAPRPSYCQTGVWTRQALRGLLKNPRYRGSWAYGKTQKIWQSKKDYARSVPREVPLRAAHREDLRIVPEPLWDAVQVRLANLAARSAGRRPSGSQPPQPRMLNGLFYCPTHDRRLMVAGVNAMYMICKVCQGVAVADRPLVSQLPRALAVQRICRALADLVLGDPDLVANTLAACRAHLEQEARPDLGVMEALRRRRRSLDENIQFLMRNSGDTDSDRREATNVLRELRHERDEVRLRIGRGEDAAGRPAALPTDDQARQMLAELGRILEAAAHGEGDQEVAREAIELLTGGRIDLVQCGRPTPRAGWLRGRFRVDLTPYLAAGAGIATLGTGIDVEVDFRTLNKSEQWADAAWELWNQGLRNREIAERLGITSKAVSNALISWHRCRGLSPPDGRARSATLRKILVTPMYVRLADEAMLLRDQGLSQKAIAKRLSCSFPTISKAWVYWHTSRGLLPTGIRPPLGIQESAQGPTPPAA
jgi:DNA invertase Pin-like site-specific DNA recombinase/predicted transcriptional regulator